MESFLKTLGLLLYIALFPLFAITEIVMDLFVFAKYLVALMVRIRLVLIRAVRSFHSFNRYRLNLPWSFNK